MTGGGTVTNNAGASITSTAREAVQIQGGVGTLTNAGTVLGSSEAVYFFNGGFVTNQAGASITSTSREAIQIQGGVGTVINSGTLTGNGDAVLLSNTGSVTNRTGGMISGQSDGVQIDGGGTVVNEAGATITATTNVGVRIQTGTGDRDKRRFDQQRTGRCLAERRRHGHQRCRRIDNEHDPGSRSDPGRRGDCREQRDVDGRW